MEVVVVVVDSWLRTKSTPWTFAFPLPLLLLLLLLVRSHFLTRLSCTRNLSFATRQIGCSSSLVVVEITVNSLLIAVPASCVYSEAHHNTLLLSSSKETFLNSFFFSFLFVVPVLFVRSFVRTRFFNDDCDEFIIIIIIIINAPLSADLPWSAFIRRRRRRRQKRINVCVT